MKEKVRKIVKMRKGKRIWRQEMIKARVRCLVGDIEGDIDNTKNRDISKIIYVIQLEA